MEEPKTVYADPRGVNPEMVATIRNTADAVRRQYEGGAPPQVIRAAHQDFFMRYPVLCKLLLSEDYNPEYLAFMTNMMGRVKAGDSESYRSTSEKVGQFFADEYVKPALDDGR
jgi:hypothetical protein